MDIDNPYMNIMTALTVPDIDDVTVVDYDALEERIYWADVKTQTIKRAFINGTSLEMVISGGKVVFLTGKKVMQGILPLLLDGRFKVIRI